MTPQQLFSSEIVKVLKESVVGRKTLKGKKKPLTYDEHHFKEAFYLDLCQFCRHLGRMDPLQGAFRRPAGAGH